MTTAQDAHRTWLSRAVSTLRSHPDVIGVVAMGSTAVPERVDEWSDHDIAIITTPGAEDPFRDGRTWMPAPEDLVMAVTEHHGGGKALYRDGHLVEWGVASLEDFRTWLADDYAVLYDAGGVAEAAAHIAGKPHRGAEDSPHVDAMLFLSSLLVGVGRARRGELLVAGRNVREEAVSKLLWAIVGCSGVSSPDRLDGLRRLESVIPTASRRIADACAMPIEDCGRQLLHIAQSEITDPAVLPPEAVAALRRKLDWN